jgi:anti-anti-sigma factor
MPENTCPVRWTGRQAVVTLPECIDRSNADQVREQLLLVINRGAVTLIADLAATVSCDYSGADALARAGRRAAASGTDLRLVVIADVVRRVLSLSGLDRLISIYPTLEAAVTAGAECRETPGDPAPAATTAMTAPARAAGAAGAARAEELLDRAVSTIITVGMSLRAAASLPRGLASQRITEAVGRLDDVVREIRQHGFAGDGQHSQPGPARRRPPDPDEQFGQAARRTALLHQRVAQTAHALHTIAAGTAALLEQRAAALAQPERLDYPTEIKRWRAFADQAAQMAERWEQRPA